MRVQSSTRSDLIAHCKKMDRQAAETPLDVVLKSPYPEADEKRQYLKDWGTPEAVEPWARGVIQSRNREVLSALQHLKSESGPDLLQEASQSSAPRVAKIAQTVAQVGGATALLVGLPMVGLGALNMLSGAFNLLAWPAHASGPGWFNGAGIAFAIAGAGLATFCVASGIEDAATDRARAYADLPHRYQAWQQFLEPKN